MNGFESVVEEAAIEWFQSLGYQYLSGLVIAPDGEAPERSNLSVTILEGRFRDALTRINTHLPSEALEEAARKILHLNSPATEENNAVFHQFLTKGIELQVSTPKGVRGDLAWIVDFENPDQNDWLVVNQLTVLEGKNNRRPDLVVYLNGLPLAVIELKNPEDAQATLQGAWNQLQLYKDQISDLFNTNELLVISDGTAAKLGSLTAGLERFSPWRTVDGITLAPDGEAQLKVLIEGVFEKHRFLDYLRHFIFWETEDGYVKKVAGYHQFHAAKKAVEATVRASSETGDRRIGVVWHTQGSGKSVSMVFFAGMIVVESALENPTLVVITDRNDLDGQLFAQFAAAPGLVPAPVQAETRDHLQELLQVASGGIVFTTIQKFGTTQGERMPELSARRNIIVIADEAHRSHYEFIEGFARNLRDALPRASYVGFTGTPIDSDDISTPEVFGEYIDTYTISQSVEDGSTVPLYYEARLARIDLPEEEKPRVDEEFEEATEDEETTTQEKLKANWARLEALVGTKKRLKLIAQDILDHWERRQEIIEGKAMIVCMSRRICVDLYKEIVRLREDWDAEKDEEGAIKVVMTGAASDPTDFHPHIRNKPRQKDIEKRFKDPDDPLQMVIVRDMWLTGFDVPCAHTMYLDKPMKGHTLMQAIARVNRVFKDKPSGLVVDYLGLADQLRKAVGTYGGHRGERPGLPVEEALMALKEKFGIVKDMFHGFDYSGYFSTSAAERVEALAATANHVLGLDEGKKRFLDAMVALNQASGIAIHLEGARHLRDEVGLFQALQKNLSKYTTGSGQGTEALNAAIRQIVSKAVVSEGVVDVFGAAGLPKPDISILSEEFLETVVQSEHTNLQVELLHNLLNQEVQAHRKKNVVLSRKFSEMLDRTMLAYQNRTLEAAEVILQLLDMAKELQNAPQRGAELGLTDDELAFYDALAAHGNVREVMGDDVLGVIAQDLVEAIRQSVTIDWTQKEGVRARMRTRVKRLLRKHGYPPDKREEAVLTVIDQAEAVCREWGRAV